MKHKKYVPYAWQEEDEIIVKLTILPEAIAHLQKLTSLNLSYNFIFS
ncbi:hypothetical protein [Nostoc sp. WHI]|nr:hypothetical protein [Nostoc sp. WHI]